MVLEPLGQGRAVIIGCSGLDDLRPLIADFCFVLVAWPNDGNVAGPLRIRLFEDGDDEKEYEVALSEHALEMGLLGGGDGRNDLGGQKSCSFRQKAPASESGPYI